MSTDTVTSSPFDLNDEQLQLREMTRKLANDRHKPHVHEWERNR